jgi:nucleotide-binding universal stress UspA family protein
MKLDSILVATDFSEGAEEAVSYAADLAAHFEAEIVLLHAYNVEIPMASPMMSGGYVLPDGFFEEIAKQARLQTEEKAKALQAKGLRVTPVALDEPAALAITGEAERRKVDLIVMGTRGLTGLKHIALGSIADKVVRTAPCPVLTIGERP